MVGCQKSKCSSSWPPITTFTWIVNIQTLIPAFTQTHSKPTIQTSKRGLICLLVLVCTYIHEKAISFAPLTPWPGALPLDPTGTPVIGLHSCTHHGSKPPQSKFSGYVTIVEAICLSLAGLSPTTDNDDPDIAVVSKQPMRCEALLAWKCLFTPTFECFSAWCVR